MAIICLARFPNCSPSLIFLRLLNHGYISQKSAHFSTSKLLAAKSMDPIKYSTNKASKVTISETVGVGSQPKKDQDDFRSYIYVGSVAIFLIYFCVLREENDIDEIIKGNPAMANRAKELYDLKIKLKYCEQNNLPKDALKAKIEELESQLKVTSPFLK